MRARKQDGPLSVHAICGIHVILLGFDLEERVLKGCLGFSIYRVDHTENEEYWLSGFKTFEQNAKGVKAGSLVSSQTDPVQAFLWGDYTVKPKHDYSYKVYAMYGSPRELEARYQVEIRVQSVDTDTGKHAIFFNRGVAASQAYARKFNKKKPEEVPGRKAFQWLSRGLEEALLKFIGQAESSRYALRAAVYEFDYLPVARAFKAAKDKGADVKIVYDYRRSVKDKKTGEKKKVPGDDTRKIITEAGLEEVCFPRDKESYISHNKFIILLKDGKPEEVWTGSVNFTEGGIFGHSNVGHIIRDPELAGEFLNYWNRLRENRKTKELRIQNEEQNPAPPRQLPFDTTQPVFSPRKDLTLLQWYSDMLDQADRSAFLTAAFGVNKKLAEVFAKDKNHLRYILMEKQGSTYAQLCQDKDVRIALGPRFKKGNNENEKVHRMLEEALSGLNTWVKYIHTKFMLIDPLSNEPLVITGSANFSDASTKNNDENMLVISRNTEVSDVYLGEFMRIFNHLYFRDVTSRQASHNREKRNSTYLQADDSWALPYYEKNSVKERERLLFC